MHYSEDKSKVLQYAYSNLTGCVDIVTRQIRVGILYIIKGQSLYGVEYGAEFGPSAQCNVNLGFTKITKNS